MTTSPYFVSVTVQNGRADYFSVALDPTQLGADPAHPLETALSASPSQLSFPTECYVVGQASTTFTETGDTGDFTSTTADGVITAEFALVPYGGLVYLVRAVSNVAALGGVGLLGITSGLLIDTYVPSAAGTLNLAQAPGTSAADCPSTASRTPRRRWWTPSTASTSPASRVRLSTPRRCSSRSPSWTRRRGSSPICPTSSVQLLDVRLSRARRAAGQRAGG